MKYRLISMPLERKSRFHRLNSVINGGFTAETGFAGPHPPLPSLRKPRVSSMVLIRALSAGILRLSNMGDSVSAKSQGA
jgi:hypothetical protein